MITSLYVALLAFMLIALSVNISLKRQETNVALGDADKLDLKRRIRAQANFTEYTPLFLLLLALAEYNGSYPWIIHGLGSIFVLGRLFHAYSLLRREVYEDGRITAQPYWRIGGMICTFGCIGSAAAILIYQYLT